MYVAQMVMHDLTPKFKYFVSGLFRSLTIGMSNTNDDA